MSEKEEERVFSESFANVAGLDKEDLLRRMWGLAPLVYKDAGTFDWTVAKSQIDKEGCCNVICDRRIGGVKLFGTDPWVDGSAFDEQLQSPGKFKELVVCMREVSKAVQAMIVPLQKDTDPTHNCLVLPLANEGGDVRFFFSFHAIKIKKKHHKQETPVIDIADLNEEDPLATQSTILLNYVFGISNTETKVYDPKGECGGLFARANDVQRLLRRAYPSRFSEATFFAHPLPYKCESKNIMSLVAFPFLLFLEKNRTFFHRLEDTLLPACNDMIVRIKSSDGYTMCESQTKKDQLDAICKAFLKNCIFVRDQFLDKQRHRCQDEDVTFDPSSTVNNASLKRSLGKMAALIESTNKKTKTNHESTEKISTQLAEFLDIIIEKFQDFDSRLAKLEPSNTSSEEDDSSSSSVPSLLK